ncbi:hypothetical protein BIW11_03091 [Tropilaelaps mercedesae]|uniref:Uncharacterized protein n=1 Tax=Tropilaelaps mercedesae TaxID=418985 RepID=A0A1V9XSA1_9ACAR|nr:hypothetical protein BIW11_03091 [Tropilaelaps mercedesae]
MTRPIGIKLLLVAIVAASTYVQMSAGYKLLKLAAAAAIIRGGPIIPIPVRYPVHVPHPKVLKVPVHHPVPVKVPVHHHTHSVKKIPVPVHSHSHSEKHVPVPVPVHSHSHSHSHSVKAVHVPVYHHTQSHHVQHHHHDHGHEQHGGAAAMDTVVMDMVAIVIVRFLMVAETDTAATATLQLVMGMDMVVTNRIMKIMEVKADRSLTAEDMAVNGIAMEVMAAILHSVTKDVADMVDSVVVMEAMTGRWTRELRSSHSTRHIQGQDSAKDDKVKLYWRRPPNADVRVYSRKEVPVHYPITVKVPVHHYTHSVKKILVPMRSHSHSEKHVPVPVPLQQCRAADCFFRSCP